MIQDDLSRYNKLLVLKMCICEQTQEALMSDTSTQVS